MKKQQFLTFIILLFSTFLFSQNTEVLLDSLFKEVSIKGDKVWFENENLNFLKNIDKDVLVKKVTDEYINSKSLEVISSCQWIINGFLYKENNIKINQQVLSALFKGNLYHKSRYNANGLYQLNFSPEYLTIETMEIIDNYVKEGTKKMRQHQKTYAELEGVRHYPLSQEEKREAKRLDIPTFRFAGLSGKKTYINTIRLFVQDTFSCTKLFHTTDFGYTNLDNIWGYASLSRLGDEKATDLLISCTQSSYVNEKWPFEDETSVIISLLFTRNTKILQEILIPLLYSNEKNWIGKGSKTKGNIVLEVMINHLDIPFFKDHKSDVYYVSDDFKAWLKDNSHTIKFK